MNKRPYQIRWYNPTVKRWQYAYFPTLQAAEAGAAAWQAQGRDDIERVYPADAPRSG